MPQTQKTSFGNTVMPGVKKYSRIICAATARPTPADASRGSHVRIICETTPAPPKLGNIKSKKMAIASRATMQATKSDTSSAASRSGETAGAAYSLRLM